MKRSFDPKAHIPVGKDWEDLRIGIRWGLLLSAATTLSVLSNYFGARQALYIYNRQTQVWTLVESRTIVPFYTLIDHVTLAGLVVFLVILALQVVRNYQYHRQGTMSIYLMKRLPDKWELHRRCWSVPLGASILAAALVAVLLGIYYIIYLICTPAVCLPA